MNLQEYIIKNELEPLDEVEWRNIRNNAIGAAAIGAAASPFIFNKEQPSGNETPSSAYPTYPKIELPQEPSGKPKINLPELPEKGFGKQHAVEPSTTFNQPNPDVAERGWPHAPNSMSNQPPKPEQSPDEPYKEPPKRKRIYSEQELDYMRNLKRWIAGAKKAGNQEDVERYSKQLYNMQHEIGMEDNSMRPSDIPNLRFRDWVENEKK